MQYLMKSMLISFEIIYFLQLIIVIFVILAETGNIYFVHNRQNSVSAICCSLQFIDHANRSGIFFKSVTTNFVCGFDLFCVGIVIMIFESGQMIEFFHNCVSIVFLIAWLRRYVLVSTLTNLFMSVHSLHSSGKLLYIIILQCSGRMIYGWRQLRKILW